MVIHPSRRTLAASIFALPVLLAVALALSLLAASPALAGGGATMPDLSKASIPNPGTGLAAVDWVVLVAYGLVMLWVGVYYSRRNRSADDYLLGGRTMKPWIVGLSMFATFFSALTYLATPGEMIAHGPMILAQVVGFPIVAVIVCWWFIPFIMRFPVTSGYEILENRLGKSVRWLAAFTFLLVRFLWMALMIYATVDKVVVPVAGIGQQWVPYVCAVLGFITVVYSSMGGLRAVVVSDAIQAIILFAGAIVAVILITVELGGVSAWWPREWQSHWDPFQVWFQPGTRMSLVEPFLAVSLWWIATAASDQMAIQRYLSTRDVRSARRMFGMSVGANICIAGMLGVLGFALLAYFQHHPELLTANQNLTNNADRLFPRFMAVGLPPGLTGVVVAALLAATMSSLSAGINSVSSVLTSDVLAPLRKSLTEDQRLRFARAASWVVGLIAVAMSLGVPLVEGNLIEQCQKLPNLLVAPLFSLFFMAMFVPWATTLGTWIGAIASAAAAVYVAFFGFEQFGLNVFWIVPTSMAVAVTVGPAASGFERLVFGPNTR